MAEALAAEPEEPFRLYRALTQPGGCALSGGGRRRPPPPRGSSRLQISPIRPLPGKLRKPPAPMPSPCLTVALPVFSGSDAYLQEIAAQLRAFTVLREDFSGGCLP